MPAYPAPTASLFHPGAAQPMWPIFPQTGIPAMVAAPDGAVYQNPAWSQQKWYWLFINANSPHLTVPLNARGTTAAFTPGLEDGTLGDFEIVKLNSTYQTAGHAAAVRIQDTFMDRWLMNNPVSAHCVFGVTEYPGQLYESIFVPASTSLQMYWYDIRGAEIITCLTAQGRRFMGCQDRVALWQVFRERRTHPYWLTLDQATNGEVAIAANTTAQFTMTVPAGFDFEAWSLMDDTVQTADLTTPSEYTIKMFEGMSGRSLFGVTTPDAVEISNVAAKTRAVTGVQTNRLRAVGNPNIFTFTQRIPSKTQIQVEITSPAATAIRVRLAIHGRAIYAQQCAPSNLHLIQQPVGYMPVPGAPSCQYPPAFQQQPQQFQQQPQAFLGPGYGATSPVPQYPMGRLR